MRFNQKLFKAFLLIAAVVLVAAAGYKFTRPRVPGFGAFKDYNVVLVTIDTLRADHLPAYGYTKVKTPNLDQLAGSGYVFINAQAHVPMTLPSHASIMTGLLPVTHGVRDNANYIVNPDDTTLAETLKSAGYTTSAFVSAFVLDKRWQLNQGFDFYYDDFNLNEYQEDKIGDIQRRAGETEIEVEHWLDTKRSGKFFLWVHYFDPHDPYDPPEPYKSQYKENPYDGEIAYTDEVLGKLLKKLDDLKLRDKTLIVVTGDHGEGLGEHQESTHGVFVYRSTIHVPLFIAAPGIQHREIAPLVRHIDLVPTLLEWLGVKPGSQLQGKSLIPLLRGKEKQGRAGYAESTYAELHFGWSPLFSLVSDEYRYIEAPKAELYDAKNDLPETNNVISQKQYVAKAMSAQLQDMIQKFTRKGAQAAQAVDPEVQEKLRSLGYIGTTVQTVSGAAKPDPKDRIHLAIALSSAFNVLQQKDSRKALQLIVPVLQEDPNMADARFIAGVAYAGVQQYEKAVDELLLAIRAHPNHTMAMYNLAYAYQLMGKPKEAEEWYLQVLKLLPGDVLASTKLAQLYLFTKQPQKALPYYEKAVDSYQKSLENTKAPEGRAKLLASLAELHFSAGQYGLAERDLRTAIEATPSRPLLRYNLAQVLEATGDLPSAIVAYREETQVDPANFLAFHNLGILYLRIQEYDKAIQCFEAVRKLKPRDVQALYFLATSYYMADRNLEEARSMAMTVVQAAPDFKEGRQLAAAIEKSLREKQ